MGASQPGHHLRHPTCSGAWEKQAQHRVGSPVQGEKAATGPAEPTSARPQGRRAAEGRGARRGGRKGDAGRQRSLGPLLRPRRGRDEGPRRQKTTYSAVFLREEVGAVIQAFLRGRRAQHTEGEEGKGETQRETLASSPRRPRARRPHRAPRVRRRREHPPSWLLRVQGSRRRTSKATNRAGCEGGAEGGAERQPRPLPAPGGGVVPEGERKPHPYAR